MAANNRFGGGVEFEVEMVGALPTAGRNGRLVILGTDLYRDNGSSWDKLAKGTDPPIPHATSHQDASTDPLRGIIKVDGIEATAVPNTLGVSANTGNISFSPGKGIVERSPNGTRWQIVINNVGQIGTVNLDA